MAIDLSVKRGRLKETEIFCLILLMRGSRSARLLVKGAWGRRETSKTACSWRLSRSQSPWASDLATGRA